MASRLPGAYGPINFQLFHDESKGAPSPQSIFITDLNPRFGGGYPLVHKAGGHFVNWLLAEAKNKDLPDSAGLWKNNCLWKRG